MDMQREEQATGRYQTIEVLHAERNQI